MTSFSKEVRDIYCAKCYENEEKKESFFKVGYDQIYSAFFSY